MGTLTKNTSRSSIKEQSVGDNSTLPVIEETKIDLGKIQEQEELEKAAEKDLQAILTNPETTSSDNMVESMVDGPTDDGEVITNDGADQTLDGGKKSDEEVKSDDEVIVNPTVSDSTVVSEKPADDKQDSGKQDASGANNNSVKEATSLEIESKVVEQVDESDDGNMSGKEVNSDSKITMDPAASGISEQFEDNSTLINTTEASKTDHESANLKEQTSECDTGNENADDKEVTESKEATEEASTSENEDNTCTKL